MGKGYKCIQNTYNFHFSSADDVRGDAGVRDTFIFNIPQLPTLDRNESKTGIFCLKSVLIGKQDSVNNIANNDCIFIQIDGLSIRPQNITNGIISSRFMIPNQTPDSVQNVLQHNINGLAAGGDGAQGGNQQIPAHLIPTFNTKTGGELYNPYKCICGNPTGNSQIRVSLFEQDNTPLTAQAGNLDQLDFHLTFDIELITPEEDQNL